MVNLIKKVHKKVGADFEAGETILDARVIQPASAMRQAIAAGAFVNYSAPVRVAMQHRVAIHDKWRQREMEEQGGMAMSFPTAKFFLTLTDRRVLVYSFAAMSGAPKELLAVYPITDFAGMEARQGKLISKLTLIMADGSNVPLDVFKGAGDPQLLIDAFNDAVACTL